MSNPYKNLWIYYLQGVIRGNELEKVISIYEQGSINNSSFIGNWEEDGFSFLFFSASSDELVQKIVEQSKDLRLIDKYEMTGEAWHGEAIESYTSGSLCISPPWKIPFVNKPNLKHILLDPGVVFGTGRHPTTEDCLSYIEHLCSSQYYSISTAIDIGTGTGLLAIAAAKLGCKKVLALDFNLLAVKTAQKNIRLNSLEDKILAIQGRAEDFVSLPADLVVANIHYDVMNRFFEIPEFFQHKWLILSGLLRSEVNKVLDKLIKEGITVVETVSPDGVWNTILAKGNSNVSCNCKTDAKY
ncbi:MAG: 50S ribosomal protein L11 methyltransferase [Desulfamplus sp.]|nr:50S ribosomal protein L11 methyltransferase [Desulfamplus sp.]